MHPNNGFGKRRSSGWAERRRYFKKLVDRSNENEASRNKEIPEERAPEKEKN